MLSVSRMSLLVSLSAMFWKSLGAGAAPAAVVGPPYRETSVGFCHYSHHSCLRRFDKSPADGLSVIFKKPKGVENTRGILLNKRGLRRRNEQVGMLFLMDGTDGVGVEAPPLPVDNLKNVIVTGANRGLGFAIADRLLTLGGFCVVLACRSKDEGNAALKRLHANQRRRRHQHQQQHQQQQQQQHHPDGRQHQCGTASTDTTSVAYVHPLDVSCSRSLKVFREKCVDGYLGGRVDIVFNNAGICLPEEVEEGVAGQTNDSLGSAAEIAARALRETLEVNFFGALGVVESCLPALMAAAAAAAGGGAGAAIAATTTTSAVGGEKTPSTIAREGFMVTSMSQTPPTVVWISSGDGELCFLGAKWRNLLANAGSLEEVKSYMSDLLISASATANGSSSSTSTSTSTTENRRPGEEREEIAFGPTPAYSLSKAAANAAVRTWAPQLLHPQATSAGTSDTGKATLIGGGAGGVRLIAVCPGDVLTRMTSKEELTRGDGVSPEEAAVAVVDVALRSAQDFPAGRFYRNGEEIGW